MIKKIILSGFMVATFVLVSAQRVSALETAAPAAEAAIALAAPPATTVTTATVAEDQIPLKIDQLSKNTGAPSQSGKLILTLVVLAGMLGAAYYFVRKYSFSNKINKSNMQIKVLSQHHLGPKKSLAIIRVAGESILVGVTDQNISMIKSLSLIDDEVPHSADIPQSFAQSMVENGEPIVTASANIEDMANEVEDDFSFAGIKTNVSQKLKSMRNFQ